jgi:hypothetical protein
LPSSIHHAIIKGESPFGTILLEANIVQHCKPSAYFSISLDDFLKNSFSETTDTASNNPASLPQLQLPEAIKSSQKLLYGRCNRIVSGEGKIIAEVVEILP